MSPHVRYEEAAPDYAVHRAISPERLERIGGLVRPYVTSGHTALDLASGTGAFSSALVAWGAGDVIAVEPSPAMQGEASNRGAIHQIRGQAEALPLRADTVDLIWISTAFHHFRDPVAAIEECRRTLRDGGHVMVRGFVPNHTRLEWLSHFPGSEKATRRFPAFRELAELFSDGGFDLVSDHAVVEFEQTYAERANFADRMRNADSILTALTAAEIEEGIGSLRSTPDEVETFQLSLLIFGGR